MNACIILYVREHVSSCAIVTRESHEDWSPTNNGDSTVRAYWANMQS